ncbi:histidine phosphatase family protein [Paenibacillus thalictri]|uniref:Histidine phosphatase family protein n=1 Tax=Paenibacillus thalictri TaxID=2527873 RepID=A0A4V2J3M2_9BACL|nr:histidine phosphatase family protein [Paenibacillus thalictri]TBL73347.1 histidine phosphatase family protein [Paenibacillus thalictri]
MKTIYLIRHCQAHGQHPDAPLTDEGRRQADVLASCLAGRNIERIVSSTYARAVSSVSPLARQTRLSIDTDPRLCERILSGENADHWMDMLRRTFTDMDLSYPGGESSREAADRGMSSISALLERPETNIAVVTHGNLMSLILNRFDDRFGYETWTKLTNPDVYELVLHGHQKDKAIRRIWT